MARKAAREHTPINAALHGAAAGLAAALLLSALARVMPGMDMDPDLGDKKGGPESPLPPDPFNAQQVHEWQARSQSPAAYLAARPKKEDAERDGLPSVTPSGALAQAQAPGPEGLAEQFSFKVASGIFGRDITAYVRPFGIVTHLAYGSFWGSLYGLLQSSYRQSPRLFGGLYGLMVWGIGPALLIPAMKLMRPPSAERPLRTGTMIAGHIAYGIALGEVFERMRGEEGRAL